MALSYWTLTATTSKRAYAAQPRIDEFSAGQPMPEGASAPGALQHEVKQSRCDARQAAQ
jgi:hypothetical protein